MNQQEQLELLLEDNDKLTYELKELEKRMYEVETVYNDAYYTVTALSMAIQNIEKRQAMLEGVTISKAKAAIEQQELPEIKFGVSHISGTLH